MEKANESRIRDKGGRPASEADQPTYVSAKPSRCEQVEIRGLRYNLRRWGDPSRPTLLLLHGSQDTSASFQFLVDALELDWNIIAPDWRGHGQSDWAGPGYWLHDFVADLALLVDLVCPSDPARLVGHSLGGNVASLYAGLRPGRVSHLVSLDAFGLPNSTVEPSTVLQRLLELDRAARERRRYPSVEAMAQRLMAGNPRLPASRARFLAAECSEPLADGGRAWLFDPVFHRTLPTLHTVEEWQSIWRDISAPTLWVASTERRRELPPDWVDEVDRRAVAVPCLTRVTLPDSGHNLHHEQPHAAAIIVEAFLRESKRFATPARQALACKGAVK